MSEISVAKIFDLGGRVAVVTGAGSGIGREPARVLAAAGATVTVADLNDEGAAQTVRTIEEAGGKAVAVKTDIGSEASVAGLFDTVRNRFGRLDVLVNNA